MTPEGRVKARVKVLLKGIGAWFFVPVSRGMGVMGIPDFIGCYQGRFFAIETKTKNGTPTLRQTLVMGAIRKAGGLVWVVNEGNVEDVPLMLKGERNDC